MSATFSVLDLCCGMGGWSIGFHRAGFACTGLDVIDVGYPYDLILDDVREWHPDRHYDVAVASPPCTEYSQLVRLAVSRRQRGPADPVKASELVKACMRIIDEVKPTIWILENVAGSLDYITPICGQPRLVHRPWFLWGDFPPFMLPQSNLPRKTGGEIDGRRYHQPHDVLNSVLAFNPLRSFFRAKIPLPLSIPMGKACYEKLAEMAKQRTIDG